MKVKREILEAGIIKLIDQIIGTMPNSTYKFIMGGASALVAMNSPRIMQQISQTMQDENGLIDLDVLKTTLDGAFKASGNQLQLEFFNNQGLLSMFVKPIKVTIRKEDIDILIRDMEQYSVQNEVSLSKTKIAEGMN